VKDLLVEESTSAQEAAAAATLNGLSDDEIHKVSVQARAEVAQEIEDVIGSDDAARLQRMQDAGNYESNVDRLGASLAESGNPLNDTQSVALAEALSDTSVKWSDGAPHLGGLPVRMAPEGWNQFYARASEVLSAEQFQSMKKLTEQERQGQLALDRVPDEDKH